MDVFDLSAKISLDTSEYKNALSNASNETSTFGKVMGGLGSVAKFGAAAVGTVSTAATLAGGLFVKGASDVAEYGDNIDKMSQKMGMSAQAYQEWDAVLQHSGTSIEAMKASMKTLANAAESGSDAFEKLGISQQDIQKMSQEELFEATISALQNVEDTTTRTYLAGKTLGRGATELGALLNTSAEDTQAMRDRVRELGGVMSDDAVKASAAYQDSLQDMQTAFGGLKRGIVSDFLPSITTVMDGLQEVFSGNGDKGIGVITNGINGIIQNMNEAIPKFFSVGGEIIGALFDAVVSNLPRVIESGTGIFTSLLEGVMQRLPDIITAGTEILVTLIEGLTRALPTLISYVPQIIVSIVNALAKAIPQIASSAVSIVTTLINGITENMPQIMQTAMNVISWLSDTLGNNLPKLLEKGGEIVINLVNGIVERLPDLINGFSELLTQAITFIMQNMPTFLQKGIEIVGKLASGILQALPKIISSVAGLLRNAIQTIAQNLPQFLQQGIQLVGKIVSGIIQSLPQIGKAALTLVKELWNNIKNTNWLELGINIIRGIVNGIVSAAGQIIEAIKNVIGDALGFAKKLLGIASPSKVFRDQIGRMVSEGFALGIEDGEHNVISAIKDLSGSAVGAIELNASGAHGYGGGGYTQNITINSPKYLPPSEVARKTRIETQNMVLAMRT